MTRIAIELALALVVAGCTTASESYAPDGRKAYAINCSGLANGWDGCFARAGDICKSAGYDIFDRAGDAVPVSSFRGDQNSMGGWSASAINRSMVIACH